MTTRPMVGPMPIVIEPKHPTPWTRSGFTILDANERTVMTVSGSETTTSEDRILAEILVSAVNAKFTDPEPEVSPTTVKYIIDRDDDVWFDVSGEGFYTMSFADKNDAPNMTQYTSAKCRSDRGDNRMRVDISTRHGIVSEGMYEISL